MYASPCEDPRDPVVPTTAPPEPPVKEAIAGRWLMTRTVARDPGMDIYNPLLPRLPGAIPSSAGR